MEKNAELNEQITNLRNRTKVIKRRINDTNFELRGGQKVVEIPCGHAEEINMLEVQLASKKNELSNMRKTQQRQIKIRDEDLQKQYAKLEASRSEANRIR